MKTIRTINGVVRIDDAIPAYARLAERISELLQAHRETLIRRLLGGLDAYLLYRFEHKPTAAEREGIREKLHRLRNTAIDRDKYASLFKEAETSERVYVGMGKFYEEIDDLIRWELGDHASHNKV